MGVNFASDHKISVTLATSVYMQQLTMRKTSVIVLLLATVLVGILAGCKKESPPPVSELIAKNWTASKVEENSVTVYNRSSTTANIRDYSKFRLNLSSPPTANYTDWDGIQSTGKYSVPTDQRLVITDMTPQLTGTNGTIEFTINSIDENNLKITRTAASPKTGNTINVYTLTSP